MVPNTTRKTLSTEPTTFNQYVAAAIAADAGYPLDRRDANIQADATAAAQGNVATCYYTGQCTIAKYAPLRGDPFFELDAKLAKNFKIGGRLNIQLVAQAFNLTNRANYGNNFGNDISSSTFGHPVGFINPSSTFTPRSIWSEFGVHFTF